MLPVYVGIDGVHLAKGFSSKFYPIVGYIPSLPNSPLFEIGVYNGYFQPENSNLFLKELIEEAEGLFEIGFSLHGERIIVIIEAFICDALARTMITRTKGHSSERDGCSRCTGSGYVIGELRSNETFRSMTHRDHHHGKSIIENLTYLDVVFDVPLDPMHLFDLGVMRRKLTFLFPNNKRRNTPGFTLYPQIVQNIESFLISMRKCGNFTNRFCSSTSFHQGIASLESDGIATISFVFCCCCPETIPTRLFYNNFLCLHVAVKYLASEEWC